MAAAAQKTSFVAQRSKWKTQAEEIAELPGLSMFVRTAILNDSFISMTFDAAGYATLATRTVEKAVDYFTGKLEDEDLLQALTGLDMSDLTPFTYSSGTALNVHTRVFGTPKDAYLLMIEFGLTSMAIHTMSEHAKKFASDTKNDGTYFSPESYLNNYNNAFVKTVVAELTETMTSDDHWGEKDYLKYPDCSNKQMFNGFKVLNSEDFHDALKDAFDKYRSNIALLWASVFRAMPSGWLDAFADEDYFGVTLVPADHRPVDVETMVGKLIDCGITDDGIVTFKPSITDPLDLLDLTGISALTSAEERKISSPAARHTAPPPPPPPGGLGGGASPPPSGAKCLLPSLYIPSTTFPTYNALHAKEVNRQLNAYQSIIFPDLLMPVDAANQGMIISKELCQYEMTSKMYVFQQYLLEVHNKLPLINRAHLFHRDYGVKPDDLHQFYLIQQAVATAVIDGIKAPWAAQHKQSMMALVAVPPTSLPKGFLTFDVLLYLANVYIGPSSVLKSGINKLNDILRDSLTVQQWPEDSFVSMLDPIKKCYMLINDFAFITEQKALIPPMSSILTTISIRIYDAMDMGHDGITTAHLARQNLQQAYNKLIESGETITWMKIESLAQQHLIPARIYSSTLPSETSMPPAYPGASAPQGLQAHAMYELVPNTAGGGSSSRSGGVAISQPYITPIKDRNDSYARARGGKGKGKGGRKGKGGKGPKGGRQRKGRKGKGGKGGGRGGRGGRGDDTADTPSTALSTTEEVDDKGRPIAPKDLQMSDITCYKCGGIGHYANDCPSLHTGQSAEGAESSPKKHKTANSANSYDDETLDEKPWYDSGFR